MPYEHDPLFNKKAVVRVEAKNFNPHASRDEREIAFKRLFTAFKKEVNATGVLRTYREHESYESKSRRKRRKMRESEIARLKNKWRENFFETK